MRPPLKILLVIAYIVILFTVTNFLGLALSILPAGGLYLMAHIPLKLILKSLKPIMPIVVFTAVLNLFFMGGEGEPLVSFWVFRIYKEGVAYAIFMAVRIVALIAGTSPAHLHHQPHRPHRRHRAAAAPLCKAAPAGARTGHDDDHRPAVHPHPHRGDRQDHERPESPGRHAGQRLPLRPVKAMVPILIPLFISAFRRADELAMAMECRCYRGGEGRTRLKVLRFGALDWQALALCTLAFAALWATRFLMPGVL